MADRFTPPKMDWTSPGDVHRRFKLFKQKCELIFEGPLYDTEEARKLRLMLLWIDDKGLEIYNAATFDNPEDRLKLEPVFKKLETYCKPQSNQIIVRYDLRVLKQGKMTIEEFVTKAKRLVEEAGYPEQMKEEMMRDTMVFGVGSDQVRSDAIKIGDTLTYQQIYNLAKIDESTRAQMEVLSINPKDEATINEVKRGHGKIAMTRTPKYTTTLDKNNRHSRQPNPTETRGMGCYGCGGNHKHKYQCPARSVQCSYCGKVGHYVRVCIKKQKKTQQQLHEVQGLEEYQTYENFSEGDEPEQAMSSIGTISSSSRTIHYIHKYADKLFACITINGCHRIKIKVDTGADTCILTEEQMRLLPFRPKIRRTHTILKGYGGSRIKNIGATDLKITHRNRTITTRFDVASAPPGSPSILGCRQAQELGIISVNLNEIERQSTTGLKKLDKKELLEKHRTCFNKIGCFPGRKYKIKMIENPRPVIHSPRSVPIHILPLYKAELRKMEQEDIIEKVTGPTDWVNSITYRITTAKDGTSKIRLCLDPRDLNKNIKREHYPTKALDELLPLLHGKKHFSVIDVKKGYWHQELDHESSLLCTFNTPFGRYRFKRLPFGLTVSQDIFQRKLDTVFCGIKNITGMVDDILVTGSTEEEHDIAMTKVLERAKENNIGFNADKLQYKLKKVNFFGHTITEQGISPTEDKLQAIRDIQSPKNAKELHTLMGMIAYLNRFSVKLSQMTAPLRELTKKNIHFEWQQHHQKALEAIKTEICKAQIISYYDTDPNTTTILQCDASTLGVGAWIRQIDQMGAEKIVGMASRCLSPTESRYSNIERECLAVAYGLQKFEYFLLGRRVTVETDHSPLEQIFKKNLAETPSRLQRFILKCLRFDIQVKYRPGKTIPVADALSRICLKENRNEAPQQHSVNFITANTKIMNTERIREAITADPTMSLLKDTIYKGWPEYRKQCPTTLWEYWTFRCDLILEDGLILKGDRIVIPEALRPSVLETLHTGHQGETKCILLARESTFWPGINQSIRNMVKACTICSKYQPAQPKLQLMQPDLPTHPWATIGTDIYEQDGCKYLLVVDYYSRFPIVKTLPDTSATTVCEQFTQIITEYGLPTTIMSDCGSQYMSERFKKECHDSNITLKTSSPYHHQANGVAERTVGTIKALWKKAQEERKCPYTALWVYRTTPITNDMPSPYELLFGRKPRTMLPTAKGALKSQHPERDTHLQKNEHNQTKQKQNYDRHSIQEKEVLDIMEPIYVRDTIHNIWIPGTVLNRPKPNREPRTYLINVRGKVYQRTREHLKPRPTTDITNTPRQEAPPTLPRIDTTQVGEPITMSTANKKLNTPPEIPAEDPNTSREKQPTPTAPGQYQLQSYTTRSGRTTKVPEKYKD